MWMHGLIGTTRRTCALYHGTNQYTGLMIILILILLFLSMRLRNPSS